MSEQSRARLLVPLAALSLVVLAGCGGGGSTAAAAGAGGASAGTTAAGSTATGSSGNAVPAEMQAYVACLNQHGVDLPANGRVFGGRNGQGGTGEQSASGSPPSSFQLGSPPQTQAQTQTGNSGTPASPPPSIDRAKLQAARDACAALLPEGATFGGGFAGRAGGADATAFNAYRSCMSDHGVTIGGGQNLGGENGGGQSGGAPVSIDRKSDSFKAANAVCAPLLPQGGQGFGAGQGNNGQGGQTGQGGNTQGTTP